MKTRPNSQSSRKNKPSSFAITAPELPDLAVGYQPVGNVQPQDQTLFRAFQSNLLSLISHELRTPLMGVLNALGVLNGGGELGGLSQQEWVGMAYRNAQRLHQTLVTLLDLASLESGSFHARLREVDLLRLVRARSEAHKDLQIEVVATAPDSLILADSQKLGRVLDLCFEKVAARGAVSDSLPKVQVRVGPRTVEFEFDLSAGGEKDWDLDWKHGAAGFEAGVGSAASVFGGVVQSEEAFLTRMREGLGSEFILIHQIMNLHSGRCSQSRNGSKVTIKLEFPELSAEQSLKAILLSRAYVVSTELGNVALALIEIPAGADPQMFKNKIAESLFRATDAVYLLSAQRQVALVLDDCKHADVAKIIGRLENATSKKFVFGMGHCPADGHDPAKLVDVAEGRLKAAHAEMLK